MHVALYAGGHHVRTQAAQILFLPNIGLVDNVSGRDLLEHLPFALLHGRRELHLGMSEKTR